MAPRSAVIVLRVLAVFGGSTALWLTCMRRPLVPRDYLMAGVVATLAAMGAVFVSVAPQWAPIRRRKPDQET